MPHSKNANSSTSLYTSVIASDCAIIVTNLNIKRNIKYATIIGRKITNTGGTIINATTESNINLKMSVIIILC